MRLTLMLLSTKYIFMFLKYPFLRAVIVFNTNGGFHSPQEGTNLQEIPIYHQGVGQHYFRPSFRSTNVPALEGRGCQDAIRWF